MESLFNSIDYLITFTGKLQVTAVWYPCGETHNEIITNDIKEAKNFVREYYNMDDIDIVVSDW